MWTLNVTGSKSLRLFGPVEISRKFGHGAQALASLAPCKRAADTALRHISPAPPREQRGEAGRTAGLQRRQTDSTC